MKLVNKIVLGGLFILISDLALGQSNKINLFFDIKSNQKCMVDVEGQGIEMLSKYRKVITENIIYFYICEKRFTFMRKNFESKKITKNKFDKIKISSYKSINQNDVLKFNPIIFIFEKLDNNSYCKYQVGFVHNMILIH